MAQGYALSLLLSVLAVLLPTCLAVDCSNSGFLVDIHNRQVHGRDGIFRYGLSIGLGTPSQNDSLWPSITLRDTAFAATDYCETDQQQSCLDGARGFFSVNDSSTWEYSSSFDSGGSMANIEGVKQVAGEDTLNIWQTKVTGGPQTLIPLDNFRTAILSNYTIDSQTSTFYGPGGTLGLGPSSTILNKLIENNITAARSFGLYLGPGFDGLGNQNTGSLVLGGYDAGRFNGTVVKYDQAPPLQKNKFSPFKITVNQVSLETSSGELIMDFADDKFDAYITTDSKPIQFPRSITEKLAKALEANLTRTEDRTLRLKSKFEDNLAITLNDGVKIVFDSSWMMDGSRNTPISALPLQNTSMPSFADGDRDAVIFGAAFLARAYMFVNYDASPPNFGLARAIPDATKIQVQPYCSNDIPMSASSTHGHPTGPSRKALIGGFCGGLLAGFVLIAIIWFFFGSRIRKFLRRNDPRLRPDQGNHPGRSNVKQTFQNWLSMRWRSVFRRKQDQSARYAYGDVEFGQKNELLGPHMRIPSLDSEKESSLKTLTSPRHIARKIASPAGVFVRSVQPSNEKEVVSIVPYYQAPNTASTNSRSTMSNMKSPIMISAYNTHARQGAQIQHSRNGSRTVTSPELVNVVTTNPAVAPIVTVAERQIYDKSLPATPAPTRPVTPATLSPGELATDVPQVPSLALIPTNTDSNIAVPLMPAISIDLVSSETTKVQRTSIDSSDSLVTPIEDVTPSTASTTYSFWRSKVTRSVWANVLSSAPPLSLHTQGTEVMSSRTSSIRARSQQRAQHQRRVRTASRSSSRRSRVALAARISRLKDLQPPDIRTIIIPKHGRTKAIPADDPKAAPLLSAAADTTGNEHISPPPTTGQSQKHMIKRKALAASARRSRAVSGISPCVSAVGDDFLDETSDGPISPVSSMGRGRYRGSMTPPLPPFPAGLLPTQL